ncbi:hypothetical protein WISP_01902 [Willisornis vidua]|uniref:Uncharacterized protein n=1 Tax=Willisornis vidua TaxID=1566151 RepID=A0ABQ9DUY2_9PASS|nr:hypothetical protein WISP_01902 [Willisornis vidua]
MVSSSQGSGPRLDPTSGSSVPKHPEIIYPQVQTGKKDHAGNYRPVSLTSVSSKVMEKDIQGDIEKYLKDNAVSGHNQNNFLIGKSCLSYLISFYDKGHNLDFDDPEEQHILPHKVNALANSLKIKKKWIILELFYFYENCLQQKEFFTTCTGASARACDFCMNIINKTVELCAFPFTLKFLV